MRTYAAFLFFCIGSAAAATIYSISLDASTYNLLVDGASSNNASIQSTSSGVSFDINNGSSAASLNFSALNLPRQQLTPHIQFNFTADAFLDSAATGLVNVSSALSLAYGASAGSRVFRGTVFGATNQAIFYDDHATSPFHCQPLVDFSFEAFSCFDQTGAKIAVFQDTIGQKRINFTTTATGQTLANLVTFSIYRLKASADQQQLAQKVSSDMNARGKALKSFAGVLYVTIIVELVLLSFVAAYYLSLIPVNLCKKKYAFHVTFLGLLVVGVILCAVVGLFGFFAFQAMLILLVLAGPIIKCFCCKDSEVDVWGGKPKSSEKATTCEKLTNWRTLLIALAILIVVFDIVWIVTDSIPTYEVYSRPDNSVLAEFQPHRIAKSIAAVYAYRNIASQPLQVNKLFMVATEACGTQFTKNLTDAQKDSEINQKWIVQYSVNMTLFVPTDYKSYGSVNEWFIRKINPMYRPITLPNDRTVITSPADCRTVGFQTIGTDQEIWLKGDKFTVKDIVNNDPVYNEFLSNGSSNGALVISRLSPQDYHRFHAPVSGQIRKIFKINGDYQSVNADAVSSGNEVLVKNIRTVVVLDVPLSTGNTTVLFVAVGANCVGSVVISPKVGDSIVKGEDIGFFQFGGSTVVMIYQSSRVRIADDIVRNSKQEVETYVQVGDEIAKFL